MKPDDLRVYDFQNEEQPELLEDEMKTLNELEFEDGRKLLVESKFFEEKKRRKKAHLVGLEPTTFRLTAERANRLRHRCTRLVVVSVTVFIAAARNKDNSWPEELIALMKEVRNSENKEAEPKPKPQGKKGNRKSHLT